MHFEDDFFCRENLYSLGVETTSGTRYLSVPVTTGAVDYEEYYALSAEQFAGFVADPPRAVAFADECRRHEHDELLLQKPGWNRGTPRLR